MVFMRKPSILFLFLSILTAYSSAQIVNIPDANFKAYLVGDTSINTNGNSEIEVSEATAFNGNIQCSYMNISDLTGIEAFVNLTVLSCHNNSLTNLDLSSNSALYRISCYNNSLTSLNVNNNTALFELYCDNNSLIGLDLSTNTSLQYLTCYNNSLTNLNIANGNNASFIEDTVSITFQIWGNPNLFCVEVDDPSFMMANFGSAGKDSQTEYSLNCFYQLEPNTVSGTIYQDQDSNCVGESNLYKNMLVKDIRGYYAVVDSNGNYTLRTDSGTAVVEQLITDPLMLQTCFTGGYSITFDSLGEDTSGFDFFNTIIECPRLDISITSDRRRRCFENHTYISYSNDGYADESNVQLIVDFPEYVHLISADLSYTIDSEGNYVFSIGNLASGESGQIHIIDSVACEFNITGLTQCTRAWITPTNTCLNNLNSSLTEWDKSSIMITGNCVNDSIIQFTIYNTGDLGDGDMDGTSQYRIYVDNLLSFTSTFQLNGEDSLIIEIPANGQTIRLEADQRLGHPGDSRPRVTIEACGNGGVPIEFGMPLQAELDDLDYEVAEHCLPIIDSYDPNDKKALPSGITTNRFVRPNSRINYTIRFQNTGTDTAYTVIVVDTLSDDLDLATIQFGAYSHPYSLEIRSGVNREPVLMFSFFNIDLVDSLTDEFNSNGFVSFSIRAKEETVNNTVIHNTADIYFDYNLPITTNDSWVTISDTVITGPSIEVLEIHTGIKELSSESLNVFPNPFYKSFTLVLPHELSDTENIKIFDLIGKELYSANVGGKTKMEIDGSKFEKGLYILELRSSHDNVVGRSKIIKQ